MTPEALKKRRQYTAEWRARNPDKVKAYNEKRKLHPERYRNSTKKWEAENRARRTELARIWRKNNPERWSAIAIRTQKKRLAANGDSNHIQIASRMAYHGHKCIYCGGPFEEIEHMIPLSRGGTNWPANLAPSCLSCNRSKGTKTVWEFLEEKKVG